MQLTARSATQKIGHKASALTWPSSGYDRANEAQVPGFPENRM